MNKKLVITIVAVVVGLAALAAAMFVLRYSRPVPGRTAPPGATSGIRGPGAVQPPAGGIPGGAIGATISVRMRDGGSLQVHDFRQDLDTWKYPFGAGYYYLGHHFTDDPKQQVPYEVMYVERTQFFNIGLFHEPIGAFRKEAERYLMGRLGLTQSQMCRLQYTVAVPDSVNSSYATQQLGFSFCPGSVSLPE